MSETVDQAGYAIDSWAEFYEPPPRDHMGGKSGLTYVKLYVHAHQHSPAYRRLCQVAGEADIMATFGLFGKLLEIAGALPREFRDGTVWDHHRPTPKPATLAQIASAVGAPVDQVERCLSHLLAAGWVVARNCAQSRAVGDGGEAATQSRAAARNCAQPRAGDAESAEGDEAARNRAPITRTKNENENTNPKREPRTRTKNENGSLRDPTSATGTENCATGNRNGSLVGTREIATLKLADLLGTADSQRAKAQFAADVTTYRNIAWHAITGPSLAEARDQADQVTELAASITGSDMLIRRKGFIRAAKDRWGPWPEHRDAQHKTGKAATGKRATGKPKKKTTRPKRTTQKRKTATARKGATR